MNHFNRLGRRGRAGALAAAAALVIAGAGFGMSAAQASPAKAKHAPEAMQLVSSTDHDFSVGPCTVNPCASHHTVVATCPTGWAVTGGGVSDIGVDHPPLFANGGDVEVHQSYPVINVNGQQWWGDLISINGATHVDATAWAICVSRA